MSQSERDVILMSTDIVEGLYRARERVKADFHATEEEVDEIAVLSVAADMIEEMRAFLEGLPAIRRHKRVVTVKVLRPTRLPEADGTPNDDADTSAAKVE